MRWLLSFCWLFGHEFPLHPDAKGCQACGRAL